MDAEEFSFGYKPSSKGLYDDVEWHVDRAGGCVHSFVLCVSRETGPRAVRQLAVPHVMEFARQGTERQSELHAAAYRLLKVDAAQGQAVRDFVDTMSCSFDDLADSCAH